MAIRIPKNKPRHAVGAAPGANAKQSHRKFSSASTATEAQRKRVLNALRTGPKTTQDLRRLGIYQCPARVKELRDKFGCNITTQRVFLVDPDGYPHHGCALYTLIEETPGGTA